jgi:cyclopropane-fatty-acyl-phospholipid synthase
MSVEALRRRSRVRLPIVERLAARTLDRVLAGIEGGTLEVRLLHGRPLRFGSGPVVRMTIDDTRLFRRLATGPRLGLGESYQAGEWRADDLPALLELLARNAESGAARHPHLRRFASARPRVNRRTGLLAAKRNIRFHYDLGNELFALFLDETMTYSCAVFEHDGEPLGEAQRRKLRMIGCGWGSFALVAAGEYGARVTGITLSPAQAELARRRVAAAGLADRVEIRLQDFREVEGTFTKVASIEMIEAIGEKQFPVFFAACDRLLAPGGRACVQTILIPDHRWERYRRSPDWIERYVFPGCLIPSVTALGRAGAGASRLGIVGVEEIGLHYAETLRRWRAAFLGQLDEVRALGYDDHFVRTWDFYLASCEAGFRTRALRDAQLVLER